MSLGEEENWARVLGRWLRSWGIVVFFVFSCFASYLHAHRKKAMVFEQLKVRYEHLHKEREQAVTLRQDLRRQIESQSDPLWIEQTLMRGLGLVPEGQKKIIFQER